MAKAATNNVLETLKSLDVAEIDAELENIQSQITELQASADKLRAVRKAVDLAVNGKPPRAPRGSKKKPAAKPAATTITRASNGDVAARVRDYLLHAGTSSVGAIAQSLGLEPSEVSAACKMHHTVFGWNPRGGGWQLRRTNDDE